MVKVNLEEEFEKWENNQYESLVAMFIDRNDIQFSDFREMMWREYQDEHGFVDESNDSEEWKE